jgi:hypothetical protein
MKLKGMVNMALISLFIIAAGYNVYRSQKNINFTDLAKENIEALANSEGGTRHTLDCGGAGIKACSATCKCNVTLTVYGNGKSATLTCYQ